MSTAQTANVESIAMILESQEVRNQKQQDLLLDWLIGGGKISKLDSPKNKAQELFNQCIELSDIAQLLSHASTTQARSMYDYIFRTTRYPPDNEILLMLLELLSAD